LRGAVQSLVEVLSLANPSAFARAVRIRDMVSRALDELQAANRWEIEVASMLSQVGAVTLPDTTVEKLRQGSPLTQGEEAMVGRLPAIADRLLAGIPRLDGVRRIIAEHQAPASEESVSLGGRVLRDAAAYDGLITAGTDPAVAAATLQHRYGEAEARTLRAFAGATGCSVRRAALEVRLEDLQPGMTLQTDIRSAQGALVVARGQVVTESLLERLRNFAVNKSITQTAVVLSATQFESEEGPAGGETMLN